MSFRLGNWWVHQKANELVGPGGTTHLEPRVMQVLEYLASRPDEVVSREELIRGVWKETFVSDEVLTNAVRELRKALGDDPKSPRYIQTYPKKGYRLVASVDRGASPAFAVPRSAWVGLGAVVIAAIAWNLVRESDGERELPTLAPLTSYDGSESDPAISPDGSRVAFVWNGVGDGYSLYLQIIGGGEPLLLSRGATTFSPTWSPDGSRIAFLRPVDVEGELLDGIFIIDALGGSEQRFGVVRMFGRDVDWSPDGELLATAHRESEDDPQLIALFSIRSGERRYLTSPPEDRDVAFWDNQPVFSPDGSQVAFNRMEGGLWNVYVVPIGGGPAKRLAAGLPSLSGIRWLPDGRGLLYGDRDYLWRVDADTGQKARLPFGEEAGSFSIRGDRLVFTKSNEDSDIVRVPGPAASATLPPERWISSTRMDTEPAFSPDGEKVALISSRSGTRELWLCDTKSSECKRLTFFETYVREPGWSPDGARIAFSGSEDGQIDVYEIDVAGGPPRRLVAHPGWDAHPSYSRDGRSLYFNSDRTGKVEIWVLTLEDQSIRRLTQQGGVKGLESEDGHFLYYSKTPTFSSPIWKVPVEGGAEVPVLESSQPFFLEWTLWENHLVYIDFDAEGPDLEMFDLETMQTEILLELDPGVWTYSGLSVSPDGQWVAFTQAQADDRGSDLMLVENFLAAVPP